MWKSRHSTNHVPSGDRFPVKDYGLGQKKEFEVVMSGMLKGGNGGLRKANAISPASIAWYMSKPKDRKDLSRLYGMEPVAEEMYDTIMRADNGRASEKELRLLEQYMKEKTNEIKHRKRILGQEGGGTRRRVGRMAENALIDLSKLIKLTEDEDNHE